ncbi:non-heme ferritin [Euhalothece natronophila Z-M001]|uniref:Ferritin n=1 Tax=Euhalothece natronophila Z-M001 TaxID=522448 RepID=A0A5B8NPL0_9CHRO|nr:non-heme ferritin [Euhalothece natronophila]QDZ40937.1 non-heme ferritin [Euhalothece natronophila Z-M001]
MLSESMAEALNKQINCEMYSSNLYLQMSCWCASKGLEGAAAFLDEHADEERMHMRKILTYVSEKGNLAIVGEVDSPATQFKSIKDVFEQTFEHEQLVTRKVNNLVHLATQEQDYATLQFLQWYVSEQHQEEVLFKTILDKIEMIGIEGQGIFFIDQEIERLITQKEQAAKAMSMPEAETGAA